MRFSTVEPETNDSSDASSNAAMRVGHALLDGEVGVRALFESVGVDHRVRRVLDEGRELRRDRPESLFRRM